MNISKGTNNKINVYAEEYQNNEYVKIVDRKYQSIESAYVFIIKILEDLKVSDVVEFPN